MPKTIQGKFDYGINLKSISVLEDAKHPENLCHYRPTHTGIGLLKELALFEKSNCFMLQAAYGTGKSLHAALAVHIVENSTQESKVLQKSTAKKVALIDKIFGSLLSKRQRSKKKGMAIILEGQVDDLGVAIFNAVMSSYERLGMKRAAGGIKRRKKQTFDNALELLSDIEADSGENKLDRLYFVWDEFGRHLESLVDQGKSDKLHEIQKLTEFCARRKKCPCSLVLIMHQSFESYNTNSTSTSKAEWRKIDGRFSHIKAGQDGYEFYQLMQDLSEVSTAEKKSKKGLKSYIKELQKSGLFIEDSLKDLHALFIRTPNIDPVVYFLVPKIASRLSQNERTVFDFMRNMRDQSRVGIEEVYSYFESTMQADTSVGGTNKLYQQTKVALLKAENEIESDIIKACALFSIDVEGKVKVSKDLLSTVIENLHPQNSAKLALVSLIKKNLLIHRKFNNEILIWHGSDLDIRSDIKTIRETIALDFSLVEFLKNRFPLKVWRPGRHNDESGVQRFFTSHYSKYTDINNAESRDANLDSFSDGRVFYLIDEENVTDIEQLSAIQQSSRECPEACFVIPAFLPQIHDMALEIEAMEQLIRDFHKKNVDPASIEELRNYLDDASNQLYEYIQKVYRPGISHKIFIQGKSLVVDSNKAFREAISFQCDELYNCSPEILNNAINRNKPSGVMVNARRKLLARVLENTDEVDFGFKNPNSIYEFSSAVASLFRTTLLNPGFYNSEQGRFLDPEEMEKRKLSGAAVWGYVKEFFTESRDEPKRMSDFVKDLTSSPYGARRGVLPILFCAGLRAFSVHGVLMKSGEFVDDIKPSDIDDALNRPDKYEFQVVALGKWEKFLLQEINKVFTENEEDLVENDELRIFAESSALWAQRLPKYSRVSRKISPGAIKVRNALFQMSNPAECVMSVLPDIYGVKITSKKSALSVLESFRADKNEIDHFYVDQAGKLLKWLFGELNIPKEKNGRNKIEKLAKTYISIGTENFRPKLKPVLTALADAKRGETQVFIRGVTAVVTESIDNWDDRGMSTFKFEFKSKMKQIVESMYDAISAGQECPLGLQNVLIENLKTRLNYTVDVLRQLGVDDPSLDIVSSQCTQEESVEAV